MLVLADHAVNSTTCAAGSILWCNRFMGGQTGVNLFFGLSGFHICSRLVQEYTDTGTISLGRFYVRRAFRILPAALIYLTVVTGMALSGMLLVSRRELTGSVFLFRNYLGPQAGFYTGHFWSLSLEEHFYLFWPAMLLLLLARRRTRAAYITAMLAVGVAVWRQIALMSALARHGQLDRNFFMRTDIRLDALLLGAAVALVLRDERVRRAATQRWSASVWLVLLAMYIAVVVHYGLRATIWESALVPLLIAWTTTHPASSAGRTLEAAPLRWLGRVSYSLYIWQQFFFPPSDVVAPWPVLQRWPLAVPAAFAAAIASYYVIERPCIRLGHRLAPSGPAESTSLARPRPLVLDAGTGPA